MGLDHGRTARVKRPVLNINGPWKQDYIDNLEPVEKKGLYKCLYMRQMQKALRVETGSGTYVYVCCGSAESMWGQLGFPRTSVRYGERYIYLAYPTASVYFVRP